MAKPINGPGYDALSAYRFYGPGMMDMLERECTCKNKDKDKYKDKDKDKDNSSNSIDNYTGATNNTNTDSRADDPS